MIPLKSSFNNNKDESLSSNKKTQILCRGKFSHRADLGVCITLIKSENDNLGQCFCVKLA